MRIKTHQVAITGKKKHRPDVHEIILEAGRLAAGVRPGQFLHVQTGGMTLLRRPFSVHRVRGTRVHILFRIRGQGTRLLAGYPAGTEINVLGPLGRGFSLPHPKKISSCILVAGGMGIAPLVFLAESLAARRRSLCKLSVALVGAQHAGDILCIPLFRSAGLTVKCATDDGSRGAKGTVTALLKRHLSRETRGGCVKIYACGPRKMFDALAKLVHAHAHVDCEVSFEQFMGCGVGVCCACAIKTPLGYKKVCKEGPVFALDEVYPRQEKRCAVCSGGRETGTKLRRH